MADYKRQNINLLGVWLIMSSAKSALQMADEGLLPDKADRYRLRNIAAEVEGAMEVISAVMQSEREKAAA